MEQPQPGTVCPACGKPGLASRSIIESFPYGVAPTRLLQAAVTLYECRECQMAFTNHEGETQRHAAVCHYLGVLTPAEVMCVREQHKLSRIQFAELLGVEELKLARWESGAEIQPTAMDRFLRLVSTDAVFLALTALAKRP